MHIATSSIGEGLDFACNLVASDIVLAADSHPELTIEILRVLAGYIRLRYAGEDECAFEFLEILGRHAEHVPTFPKDQFWSQMSWLAKQLNCSISNSE